MFSARDVDKKVFKKFKAMAVEKGLTTGRALNQAMVEWVRELKKKKKRKPFSVSSWDWGEGNERVSLEVDETLYRWKK